MPEDNNKFAFETTIEKIETLVHKMEEGDLTLQQSLEAFEKGIKLTNACHKALDDAEQKVQILTGKNSDISITSFDTDVTNKE